MKLIDKDALVAEIEKQKQLIFPKNTGEMKVADVPKPLEQGWLNALSWIKKTINTLEVKEVDLEHLEQEVKDFCYEYDDRKEKWYNMTPHDKNITVNPTWANFAMSIAKHFFSLGMQVSNKAQKGE